MRVHIRRILQTINLLPEMRLRVFGFVLLAMGCIDSASGICTYLAGQKLLGAIFLGLSIGYGLLFLPLLLKGYHATSRLLVPYYSVALLFVAASYYGPGVNVQLSIFIGAIYPFLVFSPKEKNYILSAIPAPFIFFVALELSEYKALDPFFGGNFHLGIVSELSRVSMTIASFFIVTTALFMFSRQTGVYEDRLRNANLNLDTLIRTICHDIRNPLMVSIGYTDILKKATRDGPVKQLEAIIKANKQIDSIINGVIEMQKLKGGKFSVPLESVKLSKVFEECLFTLQNVLQVKTVTVKIDCDADLLVKGNQTLLAQSVVNNILTNAIKFSAPGSSVQVIAEKLPRGNVSVRISDHGIGIPAAILAKLFDPAAHTTRLGTNSEKGTGFGLPIAKAYLEAMGGQIKVKSITREEDAQNHGTEFELVLKEAV